MQSMPMNWRTVAHQCIFNICNNCIATTHLNGWPRHHAIHNQHTSSESIAVNAMRTIAVGSIEWAIVACFAQRLIPFELKTCEIIYTVIISQNYGNLPETCSCTSLERPQWHIPVDMDDFGRFLSPLSMCIYSADAQNRLFGLRWVAAHPIHSMCSNPWLSIGETGSFAPLDMIFCTTLLRRCYCIRRMCTDLHFSTSHQFHTFHCSLNNVVSHIRHNIDPSSAPNRNPIAWKKETIISC